MIQQPDSIHSHVITDNATAPVEEAAATEQRPYETLRTLPANATPAQEDSVLQSLYDGFRHSRREKVDSVLSPDLGHELQVEATSLPTYYKDSYFAKDSLLHSELQGGRYGIAGDPVPFTVRGDDVLSSVVILSFLMMLVSVRRSAKFMSFQLRNFFHVVRNDSALERESASDRRYLIYLGFHTSMILSLVFFFYTKQYIGDTYVTYNEYTLMAIYLGVILAYYCIEMLLESLVNAIFYHKAARTRWLTAKLLLAALHGVALSPLLLLMAYFGLSVENSIIYTLIVLIIGKIMSFYKCFVIFFSKRRAFLQFFLYFCTLEITPLLLTWGILVIVANYLKVNY